MMPIASSIASGNEVYYLEHGEYASSLEQLPVTSQEINTEIVTTLNDEGDSTFVQATNVNLPGIRYVVYQKQSKNFAGNIHCEASTELAKGVCQAVGGELLGNRSGGYTVYRISGSATGSFPYELVSSSGSGPGLDETYSNGQDTIHVTHYYPGYSIAVNGTPYYKNGTPSWDTLCEEYPLLNVCN